MMRCLSSSKSVRTNFFWLNHLSTLKKPLSLVFFMVRFRAPSLNTSLPSI